MARQRQLSWPWNRLQTVGGVLVIAGLAGSVVLALRGSSETPPSAAAQGLFVLLLAICQIGAALSFSRVGRVDPSHPVRAIRRLEQLRERAAGARKVAEGLAENPNMNLGDRKQALGELSVWMSVIQEDVVEAMEDWATAVPDALGGSRRELVEADEGGRS